MNYKLLSFSVLFFLGNIAFCAGEHNVIISLLEQYALQITVLFATLSVISFFSLCYYLPKQYQYLNEKNNKYFNIQGRKRHKGYSVKSKSQIIVDYTNNNQTLPVEHIAKMPDFNISEELEKISKKDFSCFSLIEEPKQDENKNKSDFKEALNFASGIFIKKPENLEIHEYKKNTSNPITGKDEKILPKINNIMLTKKPKTTLEDIKDNDVLPEKIVKVQKPKVLKEEILTILNISPTKGFYLSTFENGIMFLYGFVNNKKFLLNKFFDMSQVNLQARFYQKNGNNDVYIVRIDSYKAMIEVSENSIEELAKI